MMRTIGTPALALAVVLALSGVSAAGDDGVAKSGFSTGTTKTLGGSGTAAQAAAADDTELTHFFRRAYYRGYQAGYYGGLYGYPYYPPVVGYYSAPVYPVYDGGYIPYSYGSGVGIGVGIGPVGVGFGIRRINGDEDAAAAPVIALNGAKSAAVPTSQPATSFRYDGGPANPVPLPRTDTTPTDAVTPATGLPVSLPKAKPASPYTYKGYGQK